MTRRLKVPLLLLAGLQVADVVTTFIVLELGGTEGNPIAALLLKLGLAGFGLMLALKLGIVAVLWARGRLGTLGAGASLRPAWAVVAVYAAVLAWNTTALVRYALA